MIVVLELHQNLQESSGNVRLKENLNKVPGARCLSGMSGLFMDPLGILLVYIKISELIPLAPRAWQRVGGRSGAE
jgi:hypothetical protein